MARRVLIAILIVLLAAAGGGYYTYVHLRASNAPLTLYGNVDIRTTALSFRVGGRLAHLNVDEGDTVHQGEPLATLDPRPYQIALQQAIAQAQAAKANLDLQQAGYRSEQIARAKEQVKQLNSAYQYAQRSLERYNTLRRKQAISQDKLDAARDKRDQAFADLQAAKQQLSEYQQGNRPQQIEQAKAQLQEAQAGVAKAQLNVDDTQLVAPASGTILVRVHQQGAIVSAGSTVYTLALTQPLWVKAYINEAELGQAQPGRAVLITTDSAQGKVYHGHIGFVSASAEFTPKTVQTTDLRTSLVYRLRIIVDDGDTLLRQGMPVTVRFAPDKSHS
ncbi:secretion protein HlyD [Celerinatantimonas yamalensis]|uniref:Secretion protein HlyD n=1 Tax=Celerinatantimonas yamalensis TaxID=559956 RepID=A0ABW9G778_9GAMM